MPKPSEICVVTALGRRYDIWETVEVMHSCDDVVDHAMLTVAEFSGKDGSFTGGLSDIKLKPGDPATVTLAGQTVINGKVYLRQTAYDAKSHAVQIGIASLAQSVIPSTVDIEPGQYLNQTLQQIGSAVFGKVGVGFTVLGAGGANMPFPRVSEQPGERRFDFIERLARMRNMHLVDDGQNGVIAFRGPQGTCGTDLVEGRNILRCRLLLKIDEHTDEIVGVSQDAGHDYAGANADIRAQTSVSPSIGRPQKFVAEDMLNQSALQLRVNHEADWVKYHQVDGDVTVQGWLTDAGTLWWNEREKTVALKSPMAIPEGAMAFMIKGIIHRQSSEEGTTTSVLLCRADGLGAGAEPLIQNGAGA